MLPCAIMPGARLPPLLPAWLRWTLVVLVASLIFVASVSPGETSPSNLLPQVAHVDKAAHLVGFAILGLTVAYAATDRGPAPMMRSVILYAGLVFYGAILEGLQGFRPGRLVELGDLAANAIGALVVFAWFKLHPDTRTQAPGTAGPREPVGPR